MPKLGSSRAVASLPLWAWPTALSLDAPTVAVAWQLLFARSFGVALTPYHVLGLGLTVWLVYAGDRLLDSFKLDLQRSHTYRHALVARYRGVFALLWLVVLGIDGALMLTGLNRADVALGLVVLGAVALYGLGIHLAQPNRVVFTKELRVGLVFALGVTLPVWTRVPSGELLVGALLVAALCSLNCLLIAVWERGADAAQGQVSLALAWPWLGTVLEPALLALSLLALLSAFWLPPPLSVALGSSAFLLWMLQRSRGLPAELLRTLVDVALLTPFVVLPFRV
ncbi:hypothetical protein BH24DEI2_BH24DEI2_23550 [soil metagenome]